MMAFGNDISIFLANFIVFGFVQFDFLSISSSFYFRFSELKTDVLILIVLLNFKDEIGLFI
jgi:hypothetical protein